MRISIVYPALLSLKFLYWYNLSSTYVFITWGYGLIFTDSFQDFVFFQILSQRTTFYPISPSNPSPFHYIDLIPASSGVTILWLISASTKPFREVRKSHILKSGTYVVLGNEKDSCFRAQSTSSISSPTETVSNEFQRHLHDVHLNSGYGADPIVIEVVVS